MRRAGFTLIELIMVIVILGILSAIALPKYVDLQAEATVATADGVLGAAASACAINYAAVHSKEEPPSPITNCDLLAQAITTSGVTMVAGGGTACSFSLGDKSFSFTLLPETSSEPCGVEKIDGMWPSP